MAFAPLHPGDDVSPANALRVIDGLRARTLPEKEWTHGAHLTAAVMLLDDVGLDEALATMPDMIRRYNESQGGKNTDTEGYHHTITVFYLYVIDDYCAGLRNLAPYDRATSLLRSPHAERDYALTFYTKELLFSVDARREFLAPDIKPFPGQP